MRGIEPPIYPWQGHVLPLNYICLLEAPIGFEPMLRELQSHALPLGYGALFHYMRLLPIYYFFIFLTHHRCALV